LTAAIAGLAHVAEWRIGTAGATRLLGTVGGAEWASVVAAGIELAKAALLVISLALFATGTIKGRLVGAIFGIAWLIAGVLSAMATDATINDLFGGRERIGQHAAETRAGLQADLTDAERWMATTARDNPRPIDAIIGEQRALLARVPAWVARATDGCKSGIEADQRYVRACTPLADLERELGAARGYEAARARVSELRERLSVTNIVEISDPLAATADVLGQYFGLSGASTVAILIVIACELLSCVGMTAITILWTSRPRSSPPGERDASNYVRNASSPVEPTQQLSFRPNANDPTSATVRQNDERDQGCVQPGLERNPKRSSSAELSARPNPVQGEDELMHPSQPSSLSPIAGVSSNPVHPNRPKLGSRAGRTSITLSDEDAVRAFLAQLSVGPGCKTQAAVLLREYLHRARVHGWPMLNKTAFGRSMTKLIEELGFEKRKEGKVTMYYGVGIATDQRLSR
jgi:hypothetical protein